MASKVNTKFVVILSVSLVLVLLAVYGVYMKINGRSATSLAAMGEKHAAEKNYKEAANFFSKAVNKDPTNPEYLRKWISNLELYIPDTRLAFEEGIKQYFSAMQRLAEVLKTDVTAHRTYLATMLDNAERIGGSDVDYDGLAKVTDKAVALFPAKDPGAESLRRFRGIGVVHVMIARPDVSEERQDLARQDLEAALAVDPKDDEACEALVSWYEIRAYKFRDATHPDEAAAEEVKADGVVSKFLAANPNNPRISLVALRRAAQAAARDLDQADRVKAEQWAAVKQNLLPRLDAIGILLRDSKPPPSIELIKRFENVESTLDGPAQYSRTEAIIHRALETRKDDADLLMLHSLVLSERRDYPPAIADLDAITSQPKRPIGLDGFILFRQRQEAEMLRVIWMIRRWDQAKDPEEKKQYLAQAKKQRDELAKTTDSKSEPMQFIDAQLSFAEGDLASADQLLSKYNEATKRHPNADAIWLAAQIALKRDRPGDARTLLKQLLEMQRGNVSAALAMAEVEQRLQNYDQALVYLNAVHEAIKDHPQSPEQLKAVEERINSLSAVTGKGDSTDPILNVLVKARKKAEGNKTDEVIADLRAAIAQYGPEPRLAQQLAAALVQADNLPGAIEALRAGLAAHPDNQYLKVMDVALNEKDSKTRELLIAEMNAQSDIEKAIARSEVLRRYADDEGSKAELAKAAALNPNEPRVIELQFIRSLETSEFETAQKLADRATTANIDSAGGRTFKARLQSARGQDKEAVATIEALTAEGGASPEAWRLLGRLRLKVGKQAEAMTAFERALEARPNDPEAVNDVLAVLIQEGHNDKALELARKAKAFATGNVQFFQTWMNLEGAIGNKAQALEMRQRMRTADRDNRANTLSVIGLLIDLKSWAEARKIIDELRGREDRLDAVALDARWYADQKDVKKAREVYESYLEKLDKSKLTSEPFLSYAQFLAAHADTDGAVAVLNRARTYQNPKKHEIDRVLCNLFYRLGRDEEAESAGREVIKYGADTDHSLQKRIAESLIARGKIEEAEKDLAELSKAGPDAIIMMLRVDAALGRKDDKAALAVLNDAAARFPTNAYVFLKRADYLARHEENSKDAMEDVSKAIKLDPSNWQALQLRATLYNRKGQLDESIKDITTALEVAPRLDELRRIFIASLIELGRDDEAQAIADKIIELRPNEIDLVVDCGDSFARAKKWTRAARYYKIAFDKDSSNRHAVKYIDSLLNASPPAIGAAEETLTVVKDKVTGDKDMLMMRARIHGLRGLRKEALASATESLRLQDPKSTQQMIGWYTDLQQIESNDARMIQYLEQNERVEKVAPQWMVFFRANILFHVKETQPAAIELFNRLTDPSVDEGVRQMTHRALSIGLFSEKMYEPAVAAMRKCLDQYPEDLETLNNLAFILAKHLHKPAEALPYAERAVKLRPNSPEILDTLGVVQMELGDDEKARQSLLAITAGSASMNTFVQATVHLGQLYVKMNDMKKAQEQVRTADKILEKPVNGLTDDAKAELEALRERVK